MLPKPHIRIEAVTRAERMGVVDGLNATIGDVGGWIDDFNFFSNISIAIRCFIPAKTLAEFEAGLRAVGLRFDADPLQSKTGQLQVDQLAVWINVTFVHREPDLRQTIPSVPG